MKFKLNFKSSQKRLIFCYFLYLKFFFKKLSIDFKIKMLKKKTSPISLLKSPHVHKKAKEQFILTVYKLIVYFKGDKKIINYLIHNKPEAIKFKLQVIV